MENFSLLLHGFTLSCTPYNLLMAACGGIFGHIGGSHARHRLPAGLRAAAAADL